MVELKVKLRSKDKLRSITKSLDLTVVNGLYFEINCQVEVIGNQMTIWITKKEEK